MAQGIGTLGSLTVLGMEMTHVRGVEPSVCVVRLMPAASFDRFVADMTLTYGGVSLTAYDMAVAEVSGRWRLDRDAYRWDAVCLDRRWKWRYPRITGRYNVRLCDGTIAPESKKNARELAGLLADALGESSMDVSDIPDDAYPYVDWKAAVARLELHWLCDLFGMTVCMKLDNTFKVEPLTGPVTLASGVPLVPDEFSYKAAVMPSKVRVEGGPRIRQDWIALQSVGIDDADKQAKLLASLSYAPAGGFARDWWHAYPQVATDKRHFAFQMAHRLFEPADTDIVLLDHLQETGLSRDYSICLDPQLRGTFSILDDFLSVRTENYTGRWRIRTDLNMIETEYPVFQLQQGTIQPAELEVITGYVARDVEYYESEDTVVSEAMRPTEPRVLKHPELTWRDLQTVFYPTSPKSNKSAIDAESTVYRNDMRDNSYVYAVAKDVVYDGVVAIDLSRSVAQIRWCVGNDWYASTRVGYNTEFDIRARHEQERRAIRRIHQMAEAMAF